MSCKSFGVEIKITVSIVLPPSSAMQRNGSIQHRAIVVLFIYTIILLSLSVAVRKLQVAILAQSSREISQTVCIDCHSFLSRVRISVGPSNFFL